ncbi:MAG: hypothetical protein IH856_08270 [Deltaproteobacteria bacterium]|nr:hypothetical protein [Deltaproteobacteria bacterium]MCZ6451515.1 hypothetical protein [Deltaproteobacteria bacterium]MCZ6548149.1 hypothetical protein [Deltaproteobacteria bacterium]MCZ6564489.1 hypothetical protein [Deltaproteobacteria bacterium]MCZ6621372.1 hypothetical protein [Deltaproteobacteria bacterium]
MIRVYDTSQLFRENTFLRIQHLYDEIAASQRWMEHGYVKLLTRKKV